MMIWRVSTPKGTHEVQAPDWLSALSEVIGVREGKGQHRFTCVALPTGGMLVRDAVSNQRFIVQELEDEETADDLSTIDVELIEPQTEESLKPASLVDEANEILRAPTPERAVRQALDAITAHVASEAGSILLRQPDRTLRFSAAVGPGADVLANVSIPEGTGVAGFCVARRATLCVRDAYQDPRFFKSIDAVTGIRTRSLLAVPIVAGGAALGCIELLNSPLPHGFGANCMADAEYLAGALGRRLAGE